MFRKRAIGPLSPLFFWLCFSVKKNQKMLLSDSNLPDSFDDFCSFSLLLKISGCVATRPISLPETAAIPKSKKAVKYATDCIV